MSDLIDECAEGAGSQGQFVSCVTPVARQLKKQGMISGAEFGAIVRCAARSSRP